MGHFKGNICITPIASLNKYKVKESFSYILNSGLRITIPKNFIFDGASIPKMFWIHIVHPYDARIIRGALVHDYLYKHGNDMGVSRIDADLIFSDIMKYDIDKMNCSFLKPFMHIKRYIMFYIVRGCGFLFYNKK